MFQKNWRCNIIMKRSVQKWMAVILSCCICLSIWSAAALAAGTGEFDPVGNLLPNPGDRKRHV